MKKGRREFFEVFRRVPDEKEPTTWWRKNAKAADEPSAANAAAVKPLSRREAATASNKIVLTFSRETLVVIAVAAALALVGAFVWGYSLHSPRAVTVASAPSQPPDAAKAIPLAMPAPASQYYTLRLAFRCPDYQGAERIAADLCAMGYAAFPLQVSASSWSVNVGRFPKETADYKNKISPVTYKNLRWTCSWVKVTQ